MGRELLGAIKDAARLLGVKGVARVLAEGEDKLVAVVETEQGSMLLKAGRDVYALQVENEARILRGLGSHPYVPRLYGFIGLGEVKLLLEEYLPYKSLEAVRGWPWSRLASFIYYSLAGLMHLHARRVIHSDIKPSNLVAHPERGMVFIDFGVSVEPCSRGRGGTRGYTCPEAWTGEPLTPSCDLYSMAAVIYYLVSGMRPPAEPRLLSRMILALPLPKLVAEYLSSIAASAEARKRETPLDMMKVIAATSPPLSTPHVVVNGVRYSLLVNRRLSRGVYSFEYIGGRVTVRASGGAVLYHLLGGVEELEEDEEVEAGFGDVLVSAEGGVAAVYAGTPPAWEPPSCG